MKWNKIDHGVYIYQYESPGIYGNNDSKAINIFRCTVIPHLSTNMVFAECHIVFLICGAEGTLIKRKTFTNVKGAKRWCKVYSQKLLKYLRALTYEFEAVI